MVHYYFANMQVGLLFCLTWAAPILTKKQKTLKACRNAQNVKLLVAHICRLTNPRHSYPANTQLVV